MSPVLVWFRQDLRLHDNAALHAALETDQPIIPLYIFDETPAGDFALGGAARWWLHHSLAALDEALRARGSGLVLRRGPADEVLETLIAETGARAVYWNRRYEPHFIDQDNAIKKALWRTGCSARSFSARLLFEPWDIENKQGEPYKVFTPFWRRCLEAGDVGAALPVPEVIPTQVPLPRSADLCAFGLLPGTPDWAGGLRETWTPGEAGALDRLDGFLENGAGHYKTERDRPDKASTSCLSPHLRFGEISPRLIWHRVRDTFRGGNQDKYLAELGWREFSYHLLFHFPEMTTKPLRPEFADFPWQDNDTYLRAWQRGRTGYPIVDAGMRQLWQTGWMHNRVRMIVASFLIKDLLIPWQAGAAWFWDTLVDADLASNSVSWQWVAGCGADAAPYFRIFNPVLQGKKFDPDGTYVRTWVPELKDVPDACVHEPWRADIELQERGTGPSLAGYPAPIVAHDAARKRALEAYGRIKNAHENG